MSIIFLRRFLSLPLTLFLLLEVVGGLSKEGEIIWTIEEIPPPTKVKAETRLREGIRITLREGKPGLKKVRYEVVVVNGKEEKRVLGEKVIREPVSRVILIGAGKNLASRGGVQRVRKVLEMEATAYCAGARGVNRVTATGIRTERGIAAVDSRVIKLGTLLYIEGYGLALAADIGGAIKGNKIDLFMESCKEAKRWGRRKVKVYILE